MTPWQLLSERTLFDGRRPVLGRRFRLASGVEADFEIQKHGPTVVVLALTTEGRVITTRQFRPGPQQVLVELPGGLLNGGEDVLDAARRELSEETGYDAASVQHVTSYPNAGYSTWERHVVVATGCRRAAEPTPDLEEEIEVEVLTVAQLLVELRRGCSSEIAGAFLGLDALGLLNGKPS
jgi:ADP-ribose pyrophosphatase